MISLSTATFRVQTLLERFAVPVFMIVVFALTSDGAIAQNTDGRYDFGIDQESSEQVRASFLSLWRTGGTIGLWFIMFFTVISLIFMRGRGLMAAVLAAAVIFFGEPVVEGIAERASLEDAQGIEFIGTQDRG